MCSVRVAANTPLYRNIRIICILYYIILESRFLRLDWQIFTCAPETPRISIYKNLKEFETPLEMSLATKYIYYFLSFDTRSYYMCVYTFFILLYSFLRQTTVENSDFCFKYVEVSMEFRFFPSLVVADVAKLSKIFREFEII